MRLVLLSFLICLNTWAGTGAIPKGPDVLILKPNLLFKGGDVKIMTNDTDSPDTVSKDADEGSAYIQDGTGTWYKKTNGGDTVDWQLFIFGALGLGGVDNFLPRWDGTGSGVLQDSAVAITDTGEVLIEGLNGTIATSTSDGGDNLRWGLAGGGTLSSDRGSSVLVTGNESGNNGDMYLRMGTNTAGLGTVFFDSANSQVLALEKDGDIVAGKVGSFIDLSTDSHADTLHIGQGPSSASATNVLEVEDGTNTDILVAEDGGDVLIGKTGGEVFASSLDIADLTTDAITVPRGGSGTEMISTGVTVNTGDSIGGVANITMNGDIFHDNNNMGIRSTSLDGSDIRSLTLAGGGNATSGRGAGIIISGNEHAGQGGVDFSLGDNGGASFDFINGSSTSVFSISQDGTVNYASPSPSLPLALDASNNIVSRAIDISAGDIEGILPQANGGIGFDGTTATDGQLLIGSTGVGFVSATLTGTLNQLDVTNSSGSITLSLPQDIHIGASPSFVSASFSGITTEEPLRLDASGDLTTGPTDLATEVAGILPVTSGGTSSSAALANDRVMISSGDAIVESDSLLLDTTSASLHVSSSDSGILIPNLTTAEKTAIATPADSLLLFDTDQGKFNYWSGTTWKGIGGSEFLDTVTGPSGSDQVALPHEQLTQVTTSGTTITRIETGNDSFLTNGSFEAETYTTGWTTSGSATFALESTDVWEGSKAVSISSTGGTQAFELLQTKTLTQYEGNTLGFTCMVKSDSAKVKLCTENGTDEKDCVFHDGNGMWKKMQAIMMVDSTGVMTGSIKNIDSENASVAVDSCEWSNDPLKIKTGLANTDWTSYTPTSQGFGASPIYDVKYKQVGDTYHIMGTVTSDTATATEAQLSLPNGKQISSSFPSAQPSNVGNYFIDSTLGQNGGPVLASGGDSFLNFGSRVTFTTTAVNPMAPAQGDGSGSDEVVIGSNRIMFHAIVPIQGLSSNDGNILTASDIVSSETMAFQFKNTPIDCDVDPVGSYNTYSFGAGNTRTLCTTPPDPSVDPNNLDGIAMFAKTYAQSRVCTSAGNPQSRYEVCLPKGLRGFKLFGYSGTAKSGNELDTEANAYGTSTAYGHIYKTYNEKTGKLILDSGTTSSSTITAHLFLSPDATSHTIGYFHFHASKNPVVNAMETIPIVDYSWENEFSARFDGDATGCTILSENQDFVATCTRIALGVFEVTYNAGFFSQIPAVTAISSLPVVGDRTIMLGNESVTGFRVEINSTTSSKVDDDFSIHVSRQGSDYKERGSTAAIIAQPTCYVKDANKSSGTQGGSSVFGYQTRDLNTLQGSCQDISVASNVVTIADGGTYKIKGCAPVYQVNQSKLNLVLDPSGSSTTIIIGQSRYADSTNGGVLTCFEGEYTFSSGDEIEMQQYCAAVVASNGLGRAVGDGSTNETYGVLELTRIR